MKFNQSILAVSLALATTLAFAQQVGEGGKPAPSPAYKAKSAKLTRVELDALLAKPEQLIIVDVRRPDELTNIGGFPVYLSIQAKDLEKNLAYIPKDRTVVTVSNHAARGLRSADLLAEKGFKVAGAVGVQDYEAEGGSLSKIAPPAPKPAAAGNAAH